MYFFDVFKNLIKEINTNNIIGGILHMEQTKTDISDSLPNEKQNFYAIDGSNLAFEIRDSQNKPRFSNILKLQETLRKSDIFNYRIICDRSCIIVSMKNQTILK